MNSTILHWLTVGLTVGLAATMFSQAQTVSTIANFPDADGGPHGVIQGADGNFYGWANGNVGKSGPVIYKLTPAGDFTTLYTFAVGGNGATSLIQGNDGNFYGTGDPGTGVRTGSVFKLTPDGVFSPLHIFGGPEGSNPNSVIQASDGDLYGTAVSGGSGICPNSNGCGTIFKLTLSGVVTLLHTFNGTDGNSPQGPLLQVADGNLYGVTQNGGAGSCDSFHITVTTANGTSQAVMAQLSVEQPAFFQWGNYAVATRQDFSLAVKNGTFAGTATTPAKPGDVIILWGTGFGPTSPSAPPGMQTPSTTTYHTATSVSVTVGGKPATVYGAALAPGYAGQYQVAIQIPASLANGDYPVIATVDGAQSSSATRITLQQ